MITETSESEMQKTLMEFFHRNLLLIPQRSGIPPEFRVTIEEQRFETHRIVVPTTEESKVFSKPVLAPPAPVISYLEPSYGDVAGGYVVNIHGSGFLDIPTLQVFIGGNTVLSLTYVSNTHIAVIAPAGSEGMTVLSVEHFSGGDLANIEFRYQTAPIGYQVDVLSGYGTPVVSGTANPHNVYALTVGGGHYTNYTGRIAISFHTFNNIFSFSGGVINIVNGHALFTVTAHVIDTSTGGAYQMQFYDVTYPHITWGPSGFHMTKP